MADLLLPAGRGTFLVARPHLLDPNFARTVVLLCDHDDERGTLGFVVNRRADKGLDEVLQGEHDFPERIDPVYVGGPVGLDSMAILHRLPGVEKSMPVLPGVYLGGDPADIGERVRRENTPPGDIRFLVGYAGWGAGQLRAEMKQDSWVVAPATPGETFDGEPDTLWRRVLRGMGGAWSLMANAPVDPSLN